MKYLKISATLLLFIILFANCEDRSELTEPFETDTGEADFSKFVTIGNSLTAGFQSGSLYESAQEYSFGNLIAKQVGTQFVQPIISDPGIGGRIELSSLDPLQTITRDLVGGFPANPEYEETYNNLGVPGALLTDLLNAESSQTAVDKYNLFFEIVLRNKGTVIEQVQLFQPTFATLWIGNNDILGYATSGGIQSYTSEENFAVLYDQLCGSLAEQEMEIMVANIPDVRSIPFFTTVSPSVGLNIQDSQILNPSIQGLVYEMSGTPGIGVAEPDDLITNKILLTLRSSAAASYIGDTEGKYYSESGIDIPSNVNISAPFGLSSENPFPNNLVVDLSEQQIIENVISSYNATITAVSSKYGFHLVNINEFFNEISSGGIVADGVEFTGDFISGGLFSLDGVHPSSQGYAIIANKFIETINEKFSAGIPLINVASIPGSIELAKRLFPADPRELNIFDNMAFKYSFY